MSVCVNRVEMRFGRNPSARDDMLHRDVERPRRDEDEGNVRNMRVNSHFWFLLDCGSVVCAAARSHRRVNIITLVVASNAVRYTGCPQKWARNRIAIAFVSKCMPSSNTLSFGATSNNHLSYCICRGPANRQSGRYQVCGRGSRRN